MKRFGASTDARCGCQRFARLVFLSAGHLPHLRFRLGTPHVLEGVAGRAPEYEWLKTAPERDDPYYESGSWLWLFNRLCLSVKPVSGAPVRTDR